MTVALEVFNDSSVAGASSHTINLNTSGVNRIAVLFVSLCSQDSPAARPTVTGVSDANGLTWALYTSYNFDSSDPTNIKQRVEVWWAYAAAQQTANTVTVTVSPQSRGIGLGIGAVSGVPATRYTAPWDADPSLPVKASNPSAGSADTTQTFSTHDSNTAMFAIFGAAITTANDPDIPSGWTQYIDLSFLGTGTVRQKLYVMGKVFSSQQTNTTVDMGDKVEWGVIVAGVGGTPIFPHTHFPVAGF